MVNFNGDADKIPFYETFEFTREDIAHLLQYMGLANTQESCQIEHMDKFIFLHGDEQEVYNKDERNFIENAGDVYIYKEFYKRTKRGVMPCRIIATEISGINGIKNSLFFMKEINKAIGGFTIFFIKAGVNYYIGIRAFNKDVNDDCIISKPIALTEDFEEITDKLSYMADSDDFIDYYRTLVDAIEENNLALTDYDRQIEIKRGIQYSYLNMLSEISHIYKVSFSWEIERYYKSFEGVEENNYLSIVKECIAELSFIKSFKANTMEMLFEADEMMELAKRTEEENEIFIGNQNEKNYNEENYSDMMRYLDNPELMIKMLKQRKGI